MSNGLTYDRKATKNAINQAGLTPRGQKFVASWLSAWQGDRLPSPASFPPGRLQTLKKLLMVCAVTPDAGAKIIYAGEKFAHIVSRDLIGLDWLSLVPTRYLPERMQRTASVAEGAILRTVRQVNLNRGGKYSFEIVSVPLRPNRDGTIEVSTFFDWNPPDKRAVLLSLDEITKPPVLAEFITIVRSENAHPLSRSSEQELKDEHRIKVTSQAAVRFVMNFMREAMKIYSGVGLDPTDYIIVIAIDTQNIAHIQNDPNISHRYAGLVDPEWMRRGVSRAAVSRVTHMPLETVRRRINRMIEKGFLIERRDGIVLPSGSRIGISTHTGKMRFDTLLVEQLVGELRARGIVFHR